MKPSGVKEASATERSFATRRGIFPLLRRLPRFLTAAAVVLTGCTGLIGVNDIFLDDGTGESGAGEAGAIDGRTGSDGGFTDGETCGADVQVDPANCGRCGHDCLGGACANRACQPVTVVNAVGIPYDFTFDDTYVYVPTVYDDAILKAPKDLDGGTVTIVDHWPDITSVAVSGGKLFWTAREPFSTLPDGGPAASMYGGVWSCTIATGCNDKKLIHKVNTGYKVYVSGSYVFSASEDGVGRVGTDGSDPKILTTVSPTTLAADSTLVYLLASNDVETVPIGGGTPTTFGPSDFGFDLSIDDKHVLWTFSSSDQSGAVGTIFAAAKASLGTRTQFGTKNVNSAGIVSDGTNVFWANQGTYTDGTPTGDGDVLTCPLTGCVGDPVVVVEKMRASTYLRLDGDALYILEFGGIGGKFGRVLRVAKP